MGDFGKMFQANTPGREAPIADLFKGGAGLLGAIQKSDAIGQETSFIQQQLKLNEQLEGVRSEEAQRQGAFEMERMQEQTAQTVGNQRAATAAQGIGVVGPTAKTIQKQTAEIGAEDYKTIENNAFLKSLGFKIEGENEAMKSAQIGFAGATEKRATMFGGEVEAFSDTMRAVSDLRSL